MPRDDAEDALLSVAQAATMLGVHPNTIRAWTDGGRLTAYRINARGDRRYRRGDVARLLVEDGSGGALEAPRSASERSAELAVFGRLAQGLAASPTPSAVARTAVEALRSELGVDRAAVYVARNGSAELVAHAGWSTPPSSLRPLTDGPTGDDGEIAVALATRRGQVGILVIDAPTAHRLSSGFVASLASTLSTSLASAVLLGRARREIRRANALRSVTKELTGTLDLGAVLGDVVELTRSMFDADKAGLWLLRDGPQFLRVAAQHDLSEAFLARIEGLRGDENTMGLRAMQERRTYVTMNADTDPSLGPLRETFAAEGIRTACVVPLVGGDQTLGLLGLYHQHERAWPQEETALVQAFADQAAVAIENARLYRSVAEQAARMRAIQDLSARLNGLTDVRAIAEAIVAEATALADYHDIRIYRVDWERRMCDPIAFTREMLDGDAADAEDLLRVGIGEGFTGWVAEHGEPLLIKNALEDERGQTIEGTDDVPESMVIVPMLYEGRSIGVIVLSQLGFDRFSNDDLQTMTIFAGHAAQAMVNASTYEQLLAQSAELARRADSQRRLLAVNERLLSTLDQAAVLEIIADGLRDVVTYDNLSIYRAEHAERLMHPVLTREAHAEEMQRYIVPYGRGLMGWAVEHMQPILANDAVNDPRAVQVPGTPDEPEAVVVVPLIADGEVLGALNVSRVGGPEVHFSDSDFELVQLFAGQASVALRNADAHYAMSQLAETDALTGLGNHGAFQRDLAARIEAADAAGGTGPDQQLAVLMMDLDRFKAYNDRNGHPAGDSLLHRAAMAIYGAARSEDRVYRYGGDEFAIILPGATAGQAARVAERIRRAVAELTAGQGSTVTITVGVATLPMDATTRSGLIAAADTALYYGKRSGTNRVVRADRLTPDVNDLRGTLEELAEAALRDGDDEHAVEHLVERAAHIAVPRNPEPEPIRDALLTVARAAGRDGATARVARVARSVAAAMDLADDEQRRIELAARLGEVDDEGIGQLLTVAAIHDAAELVVAVRSLRLDGERRSRRAGRARGPLAAHVIACASVYDGLVSGSAGTRLGRSQALDAVRRHPATFRADVLEALAGVVEQRADAGRRRRREDRPGAEGVRGAA